MNKNFYDIKLIYKLVDPSNIRDDIEKNVVPAFLNNTFIKKHRDASKRIRLSIFFITDKTSEDVVSSTNNVNPKSRMLLPLDNSFMNGLSPILDVFKKSLKELYDSIKENNPTFESAFYKKVNFIIDHKFSVSKLSDKALSNNTTNRSRVTKQAIDFELLASNVCSSLEGSLSDSTQTVIIFPSNSHVISPNNLSRETFSSKKFIEVICVNIDPATAEFRTPKVSAEKTEDTSKVIESASEPEPESKSKSKKKKTKATPMVDEDASVASDSKDMPSLDTTINKKDRVNAKLMDE